MPYGQKFYLQPQGIPPTRYRIDQVGCFVTAFCNLLERFGRGIDPANLNAQLRDNRIYIDVDDGVRDDLGWGSITALVSDIVVTSVNGLGWPADNNSIVKFHFSHNGVTQDHFCLVADSANHLIVDSYDGVVRQPGYYGEPVASATYAVSQPQPVVPISIPTPEPPSIPSDQLEIIVGSGWGVSHVLKAAGYPQSAYEDPTQWQRLADLNGHPEGLKLTPGQHVMVYKWVEPAPAPTPAIEPTPVVEPPKAVLSEQTTVDDTNWKKSYTELVQEYISKEDVVVRDMDALHGDLQLVANQRVHGKGVFTRDGVVYVRTVKSVQNGWWYGVPKSALEIDPTNTPENPLPILPADDEDLDDEMFNLDMAKEARELLHNLSSREKLVNFVGKLQGYWIRFTSFINIFKKLKKEGAKENATNTKLLS
jgi:hypothetical protein